MITVNIFFIQVQTILFVRYQLVISAEMIEKGLHGGEVDVAEEANPVSEKLLISIEQLWRTNSIKKLKAIN